MVVNPYYPGEAAESALQEARANRQKDFPKQSSYSFANGCRSSLLWQTFGIAIVSPVVKNINVFSWFRMKEFREKAYNIDPDDSNLLALVENGDPEKRYICNYEYSRAEMVDIDIKDSNGTIWEIRFVWMIGGGWYIGKAFDRRDPNKRILFHVWDGFLSDGFLYDSVQMCSEIKPSEEFLREFEDYRQGPVYDLYQFRRARKKDGYFFYGVTVGIFRDQPSFLLGMAWYVAQYHQTEARVCVDGAALTEKMIQLLGKYQEGSANENNLAARVLCCEDGAVRQLVASYAAEPYLPVSTTDRSIQWYTGLLEPFLLGEPPGKWCVYQPRDTIFVHTMCNEYTIKANLPIFTLGLENDETIFPSVRRSGTKRKAEQMD